MAKYILNTSFHLTEAVDTIFRKWVNDTYLPAATAANIFESSIFTRLLTQVEPGTVSYAIHLRTSNLDAAKAWHDSIAAKLKAALHDNSGQQIVFFTTYMEEL